MYVNFFYLQNVFSIFNFYFKVSSDVNFLFPFVNSSKNFIKKLYMSWRRRQSLMSSIWTWVHGLADLVEGGRCGVGVLAFQEAVCAWSLSLRTCPTIHTRMHKAGKVPSGWVGPFSVPLGILIKSIEKNIARNRTASGEHCFQRICICEWHLRLCVSAAAAFLNQRFGMWDACGRVPSGACGTTRHGHSCLLGLSCLSPSGADSSRLLLPGPPAPVHRFFPSPLAAAGQLLSWSPQIPFCSPRLPCGSKWCRLPLPLCPQSLCTLEGGHRATNTCWGDVTPSSFPFVIWFSSLQKLCNVGTLIMLTVQTRGKSWVLEKLSNCWGHTGNEGWSQNSNPSLLISKTFCYPASKMISSHCTCLFWLLKIFKS